MMKHKIGMPDDYFSGTSRSNCVSRKKHKYLAAFLSSPALPHKEKPMYKSKLQELCHQQKWGLPIYTCIKDGDDHLPQFKASVVVGGATFDAPSAAYSSKQALNEAAQLAFLHFTSAGLSKEKSLKHNKKELTYKSKLQELCQKQKWETPKYTCIKDGADHLPQFKASVVVGGVAFETPAACSSSKQALQEAARLAFLHFTSQPSDHRSGDVEKTNGVKEVESSKSDEDKSIKHTDSQEGFKNKLRMYAQRRDLKQPKYSSEKEGHFFRATVFVGEDWFTSDLEATAEEAENSAASTALLAILTDAFHEIDPCSYKILLQKLASEEGFFSPTYKTIRSDDSFSCIVEVEGEAFQGAAAESQKLAELEAAKAAYTVLIERKLFQPQDEILKLASSLDSAAISDPPKYESPSTLVSDNETQVQDTIGENQETAGQSECVARTKKGTEMESYLLCKKVRVFTCMPNMALPKGMVVLPISEGRWAIVALEFPNEKPI